ncbi:MAG TPA: diacylglycerol kinase family protein [Abditibacteriaceae bacterium]|nr:diacylglycerol kinase family protein [Abditibacteriaceae bacterium]
MNTHCTILLNTRAGALQPAPSLEQLRQTIQEIGLDAAVIDTESSEAMSRTIQQLVAARVQKIAVCGGDGTVSLAVQEVAHTDAVLGIIPQGTFNNFATALRLPQDLPSALRVLQDGEVRHVDLGKVGARYFTEAAGVGLFADALALYGEGTNKNFLRGLAAMTNVLLSFEAHRLRLVIDGQPHVERAVMCTVSNTYRMAQGVPMAPGAKITDGELDVIIVGDLNRKELIPYYRAFRAQLHLSLPKVSTLRAREVRIEARRHLNLHCDDQVVGTTPATITAQPGALKVLVDRL